MGDTMTGTGSQTASGTRINAQWSSRSRIISPCFWCAQWEHLQKDCPIHVHIILVAVVVVLVTVVVAVVAAVVVLVAEVAATCML